MAANKKLVHFFPVPENLNFSTLDIYTSHKMAAKLYFMFWCVDIVVATSICYTKIEGLIVQKKVFSLSLSAASSDKLLYWTLHH